MNTLRTVLTRRSEKAGRARAHRSFARALDRAVTPSSREELLYLTRQ